MNLNNEIIEQVRSDLGEQYPLLKKASDMIKARGMTKYPIFVLHERSVNLGVLLYEKEMIGANWEISLSSLEEFLEKKIIEQSNIEAFKKVYEESEETICAFLIEASSASFIFYPQE